MTSILLIEDHEVFAQAILRVLRDRGNLNVVAVAQSAEEALEQLPNIDVDLVLVDVSLPYQNGIELVLNLREKYPDLPCIMLSGHVSQHYARNSLAAGARGYLIKDHMEEIVAGIQHVLKGEIYVSEEVR